MKELRMNLWDAHSPGRPIAITTNGHIRKDGCCVMGRGTALQAARKFPELAKTLGDLIRLHGNHVHYIPSLYIFSFPVKHHWSEMADIDLIAKSCNELSHQANYWNFDCIAMPRPGCGNGGLSWDVVRPVVAELLDDRFTICEIR